MRAWKLAVGLVGLALVAGMARIGPRDPVHVVVLIDEANDRASLVDDAAPLLARLNEIGDRNLLFASGRLSSRGKEGLAVFLESNRKWEYRLESQYLLTWVGGKAVEEASQSLADRAATKKHPAEWRAAEEEKIRRKAETEHLAEMADDGATVNSAGWRFCGVIDVVNHTGWMVFAR